jgi:PAS domain S-box-containing protein
MAGLIREHDWSRTPLGPIEQWPQSLRTALNLVLQAEQPTYLAWGPHYQFFYNDAYRPILGLLKHPAVGRTVPETFPEVWDQIGSCLDAARTQGAVVTRRDRLLALQRYDYVEECYFNSTYSPVWDETGEVGGVVVSVQEVTLRVVGERRRRTLNELAARAAEPGSVDQACARLVSAMDHNHHDLPFALLYLPSADGSSLRLAGSTGVSPGTAAAPLQLALQADVPWPLAQVMRERSPAIAMDAGAIIGVVEGWPWPETLRSAVVLPITGLDVDQPVGALVLGVNARRALDDRYQSFLERVAGHVSTGIATAQAAERERLSELQAADAAARAEIAIDNLRLRHFAQQELRDRTRAERALYASEERYRRLVQALPAAVYTTDERGRITFYNEAAVKLWGRAPLLGQEMWCGSWRLYTQQGEALEPERCPMAIALKEDRALLREEIEIERPDGTRRQVLAHPQPMHNMLGVLTGAINILVDITDLKTVQNELAATKDDLSRHVDALASLHDLAMRLAGTRESTPALQAVLAALLNLHEGDFGLVSLYNPASGLLEPAASIGFDDESLQALGSVKPGPASGASGSAFFCGERVVVEDVFADTQQAAYHEAAVRMGFRSVHATPIRTRSGEVLGVLSVKFRQTRRPTCREIQVADMCARHAAEIVEGVHTQLALLESEERFRHMADHAPVMIWLAEVDGSCSYLSKSWYEFTGQRPQEALDWGWLAAVHPEDRTRAETTCRHLDKLRQPYRLEYRLRRRDGEYRWVTDHVTPRFAADDRFVGFVGCVMDVTEDRRKEEALRSADQRKDEFLATLAHELRNPLAPISNGLQVLKWSLDPAQVSRTREVMERQLAHMTRLIDDLLDVSRISLGKIELKNERLDLAAVLQSAVDASRPLIDEFGHELSLDLPREPLLLHGDMTRLVQVFANLLNNATRYTPKGGHIEVRAAREGAQVRVSVRDNGIGIPADKLERVFDMFVQMDRSLERRYGGLGIGLTLVKRLVELHGGSVDAVSDVGQGSEFGVRLPLLALPAAADAPAPRREARSGTRRRVLVVDDNRDSAETMSILLDLMGHDTRLAHDGLEALEAAQSFRPDVVLLDIGLPKLNGYEVCKRLREEHPAGQEIVVVALTGWGQAEDQRRSKEAGFDSHLVKPVEPARLEDLIASLGAVHA